jgi:hypothetical protein
VPEAIVQHGHLHIGNDTDREVGIVRSLPSGVQAVYTTWLVDAEVLNGGFNQYFFNVSGRFAGDALAGYELLGAEAYATVMRAAIATFEADRDRLAPFYELHTLEAFSESYKHTDLGEVDQRYYALGDQIHNIWSDAVRTRPQLFVGGEFRPRNRLSS